MATLIVSILTVALLAAAMASDNPPSPVSALGDINRVAFKLFQASNQDSNFVMSPISVQIALGMLYIGAEKETRSEIHKALQFTGSDEEVLQGFHFILNELNDTVLSLANNAFVEDSFELKKSYTDDIMKFFGAAIEKQPFSSNAQKAVENMNQWASKSTRGKITDIFNTQIVTPDTRLVLASAIYFKAMWAKKFDPINTEMKPFHVSKKETKQVSMMTQKGDYKYGRSEFLKSTLLEIPYAGNKFSMLVILPDAIDGLKEVEAALLNYNLADDLKKMHKTEVIVSMPKFKVKNKIDLNGALRKLGITKIFSQGAELGKISAEPLMVSKVFQEAFIEVNEEGTEAAAVTVSRIQKRSLPMYEEFLADRPFLYAIHANSSHLFIGKFQLTSLSPHDEL